MKTSVSLENQSMIIKDWFSIDKTLTPSNPRLYACRIGLCLTVGSRWLVQEKISPTIEPTVKRQRRIKKIRKDGARKERLLAPISFLSFLSFPSFHPMPNHYKPIRAGVKIIRMRFTRAPRLIGL